MTTSRILIVDDDPTNIAILADILKTDGETFAAKGGTAALKWVASGNTPDLILLDVRMPEMDGYEAFCGNTGYTREELLEMSIEDIEHATDAPSHGERFASPRRRGSGLFEVRQVRKNGAAFPVEMSVRIIELDGKPAALAVCRDITRRRQAEEELGRYREQLEILLARRTEELKEKERTLAELERDLKKRKSFRNIVGKIEAMQTLYSRLEELADLPSTVLIIGETGTGKDLVAEALHYGGVRRDHPLVRVACSDLTENLIESELFGHVRGAFSGAMKDRPGRFARAGRGTLFLDEIGDISPQFQKRLLRVMEERTFERVGASRPIRMEARIVAATHRDLTEMVRSGAFREDLYYRLKVVEIHLPPLRERRGDLRLLADFYLGEFNRELGKKIEGLSEDVMKAFMEYPWPGNVRELKHAIEHASIPCKGAIIRLSDLPLEIREYKPAFLPFPGGITRDEASIILRTLQDARWNKTEAARTLGMSRQTLYRKLKSLDAGNSTQ